MKPLLCVLCLLHLFSLTKAQSNNQTIVVTFNQPPASASSSFAVAKYNKDAVFQMEFDDRVGQFRDVYAYMNGGRASDSVLYPGKTYTDGCGNKVNFRAGIACNAYANLSTSDWEYYGTYITWTEIRNYLTNGWLPENHGLRHNTTDQGWPGYYNDVAYMHRYIADSTNGFSCRTWVSPNNDDGYLSSVQSLGYLASTSQGARDGYPAYPAEDWYHYTSIEALPADGFIQFTRNLNWDWTPSSVTTNLNPLIDGFMTGNTSTNHKLMRLFSHGEVWSLDGFKQFTDYLQLKANDRVWICTLQEFMEYQEAKRRTIKTEVLSGNTLTITLDRSKVPDSAHFQDLSLLVNVTGAAITNVSVSGADRFSFNPSTGLINVFKWRKYGTPPPSVNQPPAANAGPDTTAWLPTNRIQLNGSGTDADGTIAAYNWSKVSGPSGNSFSSTTSASTTVSGLVQGVYVFRLTVTDNEGAAGSDDVTVTVNAAPAQSPVTITAPASVSVVNDPGKCGAGNVALGTPATTGNVQSVNNNAPTIFPVGITSVTWTATGVDGSTATAVQMVTVTDNEKPQITCPAVANLCYNSTNTYTINETTTGDNCGIQSVTYSITGATSRTGSGTNASGTFNPGSSTITWTANDVNGNSNSCQKTVVVDNPLSVTIPDAYAVNKGADVNTVYLGYAPASSIKLTVKPSGGTGTFSYLWSTGNTSSSITVSPTATTTYTVTVKDGMGCTATTTKTINVVDARCGAKNDMVLICAGGTAKCIKSNSVTSQLNSGAYLGACKATVTSASRSVRENNLLTNQPELTALPNPTHTFFTFTNSDLDMSTGTTLIVRNSLGMIVEKKELTPNQTIQFGSAYRPGVYMAELIRGKERTIQKLIKLGE